MKKTKTKTDKHKESSQTSHDSIKPGHKTSQLLPYMWKKGQSGNPAGRPKGKTMKDYAREWLERMTDEERDAFMEGIPKDTIWKMAEGNPKQDTELSNPDGNLKTIIINRA